MKLVDAIQRIQYDSSWGIWAETPFTSNSEVRYGHCWFDILDSKEFFADGVTCGDYLTAYCEGIYCLSEFGAQAAKEMIAVIETARELLK